MNAKLMVQMDGKRTRIFNSKVFNVYLSKLTVYFPIYLGIYNTVRDWRNENIMREVGEREGIREGAKASQRVATRSANSLLGQHQRNFHDFQSSVTRPDSCHG